MNLARVSLKLAPSALLQDLPEVLLGGEQLVDLGADALCGG
jgi:hypothetical protein